MATTKPLLFVWGSALLLVLGFWARPAEAEWKPASGPLMTRWARDVTPERVHPEYPRPTLQRDRWLNLNGLWQLAFAREGEDAPTGKDLPEQILVPFPVESALSGIMKHGDRLWYRRHFTVPKEWAGQRVLLHFGAVDWEATVWVNGKKLGSHRGGYDPFSFDITDALKKDGEQEVVVGVWDPTDAGTQPRGKQVRKPGGIFYTPTTGIWQTVWLEPVPAQSIEGLKIIPDVDGKKVQVTVQVRGGGAGQTVRLVARDGGKNVAEASGRAGEAISLTLAEPKPWSPQTPFLYDLDVELRQGDRAVDRVRSYFGMRKIAVGRDSEGVTRLLLNGKPIFQVGPLDQGFWPDGLYAAPTDEALKYDVEITKKLGFNTTRKHVKVEPERWYYWCDRLGLLVWQDMPSGDRSVAPGKPDIERSPESAKQFELELRRMIDGRHNHPSIIGWVVFNEGWGQFDTQRITDWTKQYDPTRLADGASGWNDRKVGDVHDIHVYPGPGSPEPEAKRAAMLGEFGGLGLKVDGHTWQKETWGYRQTENKEQLTRKYEKLLREAYKLRDRPGLSGAIYTQLTDVETEANGLLTYDRAVIKVDLERVAAANNNDFSRVPALEVLVPTSQSKGLLWRYTLKQPGNHWFRPDFNDSGWMEGNGGFGTKGTPGAVVRTEWKTRDIWLRRIFTLDDLPSGDFLLSLHHDEDAEVYINGVLAARVKDFTTDYEEVPISREARGALRPGKNLIAIHCKQTGGGQYIDAGLLRIKPRQPSSP
jgi:hypothetical protein